MATVPQPQLKLPTIVLALAMVVVTAAGVRAATATWDPNTEPDLAGYKLSYGTQSGVHTVVLDVGRVTTYQFNPPPGHRYYVVVQAYNASGQLSNKSAEVVVDIPVSTQPGSPVPTPPATPPTQTPGSGAPTQPPVSSPNPPSLPGPSIPSQPAPGVPASGVPPPTQGTPLRLLQPPNQTTGINTSVVLAIAASHRDGKPFTFSTTGLPPGLSINPGTGVITGTPHTTGFYRVMVAVSDGAFSAAGDFNWSIVAAMPAPATPNQPPILEQPEDRKSPHGGTVAFNLSAIDPEGRPVTFSASGLPPGLSIDSASGLISGTAETLGLYYVAVTASDGELAADAGFRWAVVHIDSVAAANRDTNGVSTSTRALETDGNAVTDPHAQDYLDVSGDFDGDGRNDLATYRQSTSEWRIWTSGSNFATATVRIWGVAGDRPVPADYDGDRITDFAVYRPSTGTWHLALSGTQMPLFLEWGGPDDVPVPLDHDGDGKADLALIRGGGYEILLSSANYLKSVRVY